MNGFNKSDVSESEVRDLLTGWVNDQVSAGSVLARLAPTMKELGASPITRSYLNGWAKRLNITKIPARKERK